MSLNYSLAELQKDLRRVLTEPEGVEPALRTAAGRRVAPLVAETPALDRRLRLAVYADAYFLRLLAALETDFAAARAAAGEDRFRELCAAYLKKNPPGTPNITDAGEAFPRFLKSEKPAWLADLAALDWAVLSSLYSERTPPIDPAKLQAIPQSDWPKLRFQFSPTVRLIRSQYDIDRFWREREKRSPKPPKRSPRAVLVYRDEDWIRLEKLSLREADALERLMRGRPLSEACQDIAPPLSRWLPLISSR